MMRFLAKYGFAIAWACFVVPAFAQEGKSETKSDSKVSKPEGKPETKSEEAKPAEKEPKAAAKKEGKVGGMMGGMGGPGGGAPGGGAPGGGGGMGMGMGMAVSPGPPKPESGNISWMLVSSAFVLMMTGPGLALFYGGLVRKKNILGVMMQCLFLMGMNSILWYLFAYSLCFAPDGPVMFKTAAGKNITWIGSMKYALLAEVGPDAGYPSEGLIPRELHMIYQMMFFIITPGLIAGAFAERMKFSGMVLFSALWGILVYCPLAHWVWGPSALFGVDSPYRSLDFAGGLVVHASSGVSALICALYLGKRVGYGSAPMMPHNLTYTMIGTCLLWVGWFGFNAGSSLKSDNLAVNAFVVTHLCAAAGLLTWACAEWLFMGKPSVLGACSGAVAGLVVVTPASGFVTPGAAIIMGVIGAFVCFIACTKVKASSGYDDSLDAFGVHGIGGTIGAILTGVFASKYVDDTILPNHVPNQIISLLVTYGLSIVATYVLLKVVDLTVGLRVSEDEELRGLDLSQHNEEGYNFLS